MDLDGAFDDDQARALAELEHASLDDVLARTRMLEHELRVLRDESNRVNLECQSERERVKDNQEKLIVKSEEEYTSPVSKIYKVSKEYIIITENSIYIVDVEIPTKRISS